MVEEKARVLRVAAVQMESKNGLIQDNLDRATSLIDRAAQKGAELILLPEFMPTGYIFTRDIWDAGEPREGPTVRCLREHSRRLGVWLGTSFLEAEGDDFFNTFVLVAPDGEEAGRVRKQTPAGFEAYFFKGDAGPHLIDTELGKIGVGICYENHLAFLPQLMHRQSADLVLMPHSAPTILITRKFTEIYNNGLRLVSGQTAQRLGVPVVMVNKSGPWQSPLPGLPFAYQTSRFPGFSAIVDSDGTVKSQLGHEEGVIVEDITLDPSRKTHEPPQCYGRWANKVPWLANLMRVTEFVGAMSYSMSSERKRRAREISQQGS